MVARQIWCCEDRSGPFIEVFRRSATAAGYDLRLFAPDAPPADFTALADNYRHLSPNTATFELAVFRRYFEVRDRLAALGQTGAQRFIIADSDLLVRAGPHDLPAELTGTDALAGSIGTTAGVAETDISPHFSIWSYDQLAAFCAFVGGVYARQPDRLVAIHAARIAAGNRRAAISDMTLLHLWVSEQRVPFVDSNRVFGDLYLDHNITMADCANARFARAFGRKALAFANGGVTLRTTGGAKVRPAILHFVGRSKSYAAAVETGDAAAVAARSLYITAGRQARRWLVR